MAANERLRDRYPAFNCFAGSRHEFLDTGAAVSATVDGRIKSIFPFIVRRTLAFSKSLKPRERVNFDPEDVLTEIWAVLAEKDGQWNPEKGRYITFAGTIIDRELSSIRDRSRTVQSPRNSSCRLKQYRAEEEAGTLTERRRKTARDILRTGEAASMIGCRGDTDDGGYDEPGYVSDPLEELVRQEEADEAVEAVRGAVGRLDAFEADVLSRLYGLSGYDPKPVRQVATDLGLDAVRVSRIRASVTAKIKKHLTSIGHPAAHELN